MLREQYERMRKRFGEDSPGMRKLKAQVDELEKSLKGQQAMKDDRKLDQMVRDTPAMRRSTKPEGSEDQAPDSQSEDPRP